MIVNETKLLEKLQLIEALFAGAKSDGERVAAETARQRILERLDACKKEDPPVEFRFTMRDVWTRKVFLALLRRYEIEPYRYKGQRQTTVMAQLPAGFAKETLWPEFQQLSETLHSYLSEMTDRVIGQVLHGDLEDAEVRETPQAPPALGRGGDAG